MSDYEERRISKKDRADPKLLFMQQVTRCLQTVGTSYFDANVEGLFRMLPTASFMLIQEQADLYQEEKEQTVFKTNIGVRMGHKDDPLVWDSTKTQLGYSSDYGFSVKRFEDGTVDWEDPNIYSPYKKTVNDVEYNQLFRMILTEAQECGIWWTGVTGGMLNLPEYIDKLLKAAKDNPRTPQ